MKNILQKLDLVTMAFVAAMVVLLSTMILLVPAETFAQGSGGDGDGDGDGDAGYNGSAQSSYITANIKQVEVKTLTQRMCLSGQQTSVGMTSDRQVEQTWSSSAGGCNGVQYQLTLQDGRKVSFIRTTNMSLSQFYNQIRMSGFVGEMDLMMQLINKIGTGLGTHTVNSTASGFSVNTTGGGAIQDSNYWSNLYSDFINNGYSGSGTDVSNIFGSFSNSNSGTLSAAELQKNIDMLNLLIDLMQKVEDLKAQLEELRGGSGSGSTVSSGNKPWCAYVWRRALKEGDSGDDVVMLQRFLNNQGFRIAASGAGSPGNESNFFGSATAQALVKFQERYTSDILTPAGQTRGSGYFGSLTQQHIKRLCAGGGSITSNVPFGLSDVVRVVKREYDPEPEMVDDEYTVYSITVKGQEVCNEFNCGQLGNSVRRVKIGGDLPFEMIEEAFRKVKFTGDVLKLMAMATPANDFPLTVTSDDLTVTAKFGLNNGCLGYVIDWGDGEESELPAPGGEVCTQAYREMAIAHEYDEADSYTIKVTIIGGEEDLHATRKVTVPLKRGIKGTIEVGPTAACAVVTAGSNCGDDTEPLAIRVAILDEDGLQVTETQSDEDGYYEIALDPGTYIVSPGGSSPLPSCPEKTTTVTNVMRTLNFTCDSGIR